MNEEASPEMTLMADAEATTTPVTCRPGREAGAEEAGDADASSALVMLKLIPGDKSSNAQYQKGRTQDWQ